MGVGSFATLAYILTVLLSVKSQLYGSYGYPSYGQYYPAQNPVYYPYPYQSYVSNQPVPYTPYYGYPYAPQNYPGYGYPAQSYPAENYPSQDTSQQSYPSIYPQYRSFPSNYLPYPYVNNGSSNLNETGKDPYADLKVDIIDIEPQYFSYYKRFFNLEDNVHPVNVIDGTSGGAGGDVQQQSQAQPYYTVKTESKSFNYSSVPQTINTHDVKTKTYSFKRTFTVDPSKKESAVINLNFVNGVQVTTTQEPEVELADQTETTAVPEVVSETVPTTTESEEPSNILTWI